MSDRARGAALLRDLVADVDDPHDDLTSSEALARVVAADVEAVLHPQATQPAARSGGAIAGRVLATGVAASPGTASGVAVFDTWRALDACDDGATVILVRVETSPADEPAMGEVAGVLTSRGGLTSHAAVVARGRGLPAVCGAESLDIGRDAFTTADGIVVHEGDPITIDGSVGEVRLGAAGIEAVGGLTVPAELHVVLGWADDLRAGRLGVRANADTAADAARARAFGAEGIGLCRTEHQFLGERLPLVQRMILADSTVAETEALDDLERVQRDDFVALLEAMDGLPVAVRLLDAPLHEFLPDVAALAAAEARGLLDEADARRLAAARRWHEHNPMLGVRGVRLAMLKPALYRMQVRALVDATIVRLGAGGDPRPQVLVPMITDVAELTTVRGWIDDEIGRAGSDGSPALPVLPVGAMIETPRAALQAGELAAVADFLSFGTNDLTQMTFGFSRDDVGALVSAYVHQGVLGADPFASIDVDGVGELVTLAVQRARQARPDVPLGVCGEHGGDPGSIGFFLDAGLDYVSCSPFRVPVARLAAGQAALARTGI